MGASTYYFIAIPKDLPQMCTTVLKYKTINFQANCEYFGVRFMPTETQHFKYSMKEVIDRQIPLADMLKIELTIMERLITERDFGEE